MITPRTQDVKHKIQMYRLLAELLRHPTLAQKLQFKGGTYAALRGELDRFSVDLDFDLPDTTEADRQKLRTECYKIFKKLSLEIKDESKNHLQFFLKYKSKTNERNTLKLEINDDTSPKNIYEKIHLMEIDMYCNGHSLETMFANKLVAAKARFDKNGNIAGRDFYDLHHFFLNGLVVNQAVVEERTGLGYEKYLQELILFIKTKVDDKVLNQDLNPLLPSKKLNASIKLLKPELLIFLKDEIERVKILF